MITDHGTSDASYRLIDRPGPGAMRPRIVLVEPEPEMVALLRDLLAEGYEVAVPASSGSVSAVDAENPDVILIGTPNTSSPSALSSEQIVVLARRHMRLHDVPIVVLSAEPDVLANARSLTGFGGVTLVAMPFDAETLWRVIDSVAPEAPWQRRRRLPDICRHGFDLVDGGCSRCI